MNRILTVSAMTLLFLFSIPTSALSPEAASGPAPPGPTNLTAILEKAGRFTTFIRLLKSTKVADQIYTQLNDSNQALTVFAPTDAAFSDLKSGTLNSLPDDRKMELMQFHVIPALFSPSQFDTASNPLRTQAGGAPDLLAMNVTATGSQVNITTGYTNASVGSAVYADDQLAVYEVDKVLLPRRFFEALPPSPPPPPPPSKARSPKAPSSDESAVASTSCEIRASEQVVRAVVCAVLVVVACFQGV